MYEKIISRRSTKCYKSDMPSDELIDKVINAGLYAANGRNWQSPIIIAIKDKAVRDKLAAVNARVMGADIDPFYNAPVVLCVLADKSRSISLNSRYLKLNSKGNVEISEVSKEVLKGGDLV